MKLHYYPGCTLKEKATNLDESTHAAMEVLGYTLTEPEGWTCCGAEYPLTEDKIVGLAAPTRILRQVEMEGGSTVVTTCAFCYNVLKRTNETLLRDPIKYRRMNAFLKDDIKIEKTTHEKTTDFPDYDVSVKIQHLLEFLRESVGFDTLKNHIKRDISELKIAPYYGCRLLRPENELHFDNPENPSIFEEFTQALGCEVIDFAFKQECCGSYISVNEPEAASEASYQVMRSAALAGADALILSCPLCYYNMDTRQDRIKEQFHDFNGMPILYFTQLLSWVLGVDETVLGLDQHYFDPRPLLHKQDIAEVVS